MRSPLVALIILCATFATANVPVAAAGGVRWRGHVVTYRNLGSYGAAVEAAVAAWNAAPVRLRLVPARPGHHAQINIKDQQLAGDVTGMATYPPDGHVWITPGLDAYDAAPGLPAPLTAAAETAAHEIGHALGLPHSAGECDLMNPSGYYNKEECEPEDDKMRCGPQTGDVRRLAAKYGWRTAAGPALVSAAGFGLCDRPAPPDEGDGSGEEPPSGMSCVTIVEGDTVTQTCTTTS